MTAHAFLTNLALVLLVAAVTTVVFQRLKQPVVLGYLLAGLIIGPHVPIPLVADREMVNALSELGVILLMFSLGLEFSLRKLMRVGAGAALVAVVEITMMLWMGYVAARLLGWTPREALYTGALVSISSTTIIIKAFGEQRVGARLRELVIGILIVEDLAAILLLAVLTTLSSAEGVSPRGLLITAGRLAAFLVGLMVVGMLVVPRAMRAIVRLDRPETTLVASIGLCFGVALLAQSLKYSVALGAFLAGSLVAESGVEKQVEALVNPVRDMFGAIFFVAVGMLIEPVVVARHWSAVLVLVLVVMFGKVLGVAGGAILAGKGIRTSVQAGMSLSQIGEFSFIIAGLGLQLGATREFLYPVAIAVSAVTTLTTPFFIRGSVHVASWLDRKLPRSIQTFAALYASWLERLRTARSQAVRSRSRRLARLLALDFACIAAILIGLSLEHEAAASWLGSLVGERLGRPVMFAAAGVVLLPFFFGVYRIVRALGQELALSALPRAADGKVDLAAAPRRTLMLVLQLSLVLVVLVPLAALTQPFLPLRDGLIALALVSVVFFVALWRRAADLQGHVRAGVQVVIERLAQTAHAGAPIAEGETAAAKTPEPVPEPIQALVQGIGEPVSVHIAEGHAAVNRTLRQVNLRGLTGAMILAIQRGAESITLPSGSEVLRAGDVLIVAGPPEAIEEARELLGAKAEGQA